MTTYNEGDGQNTPVPTIDPVTGQPTGPYQDTVFTGATSRNILAPWASPLFWQGYGNYGPQFPNQATQIGAAMYSNIMPQAQIPPWAVQNLPGRLSGPGMINGGMMGNYGPAFAQFGQRTVGNPYPLNGYGLGNMNVPPPDIRSPGTTNYNPFLSNQNGGVAYGAPGGLYGRGMAAPSFNQQESMMSGGGGYGMPNSYGGMSAYGQRPMGPTGMDSGGYGAPSMMSQQAAPQYGGGGMGRPSMMPDMGGYSPAGQMSAFQALQQPYGPGFGPQGMGQYGGMRNYAQGLGGQAYGQDNPVVGGVYRGSYGGLVSKPMLGSQGMGLRTGQTTGYQAPDMSGAPQAIPGRDMSGAPQQPMRAADSSYGGRDPYSTQAMVGSPDPNVIQPGRVPGGDVWETAPNRTDPGSMSGLFGILGGGLPAMQQYQNWYRQQYGNQAPGGPTAYWP